MCGLSYIWNLKCEVLLLRYLVLLRWRQEVEKQKMLPRAYKAIQEMLLKRYKVAFTPHGDYGKGTVLCI